MKLRLTKKTCFDWDHLLQSYKTYVNKDFVVLEIGASNKERTSEIAQYCRELIGVEYFPERKPIDFENVKYLVGDWQNLSKIIRPESIDVAISSHVIEHVRNDLRAIKRAICSLETGG